MTCERDGNGWRIPREGTRSRRIYRLMIDGNRPKEIHHIVGGSRGSIRVLMHKMKNAPEPYSNGMPTGRPRREKPRRAITLPQLKCLTAPCE